MNGSAAWQLEQGIPPGPPLVVFSQYWEPAAPRSDGLGTVRPSRPASRWLWKKQVRPVARLCWIIAISSARGSVGPADAWYLRQIAIVVTFGRPVSILTRRENGTHWLPASPSCTGLSQLPSGVG